MTIHTDHRWALVLAAGSGTRLSSLTTDATGETVPKQFCSLNGGPSLLRRTLARAFRVAPWSRTTVVVAADHRRHWQDTLPELTDDNVVVQPENKGTAIGILLPLLHILSLDPDAHVALLPSDHHIEDEDTFGEALSQALDAVADDITLLGIAPDSADPELGYIVGGTPAGNRRQHVARFVEKPTPEAAECLVAWGALWNSFVIVAQARTLADLIARRYPAALAALARALGTPGDAAALAAAYGGLPTVDMSRDVITPAAREVKCLRVPSCGWTDLGTPHRVAECLSRLHRHPPKVHDTRHHPVVLDLAEAHRRRQVRAHGAYEPAVINQLVGELQ